MASYLEERERPAEDTEKPYPGPKAKLTLRMVKDKHRSERQEKRRTRSLCL